MTTPRSEPWTPSVDEGRRVFAAAHSDQFREQGVQAFDRMIEAVRAEEIERCAQIAERLHGVGNDVVAARIREGR